MRTSCTLRLRGMVSWQIDLMTALTHIQFVSLLRRVALAAPLLASSVLGGARAADVPPSPDKLERITEFFNNEVTTGKLPGAVILIQQHGRPVYLKCFGVRDVAAAVPMTPDTIFALHSMTKPITSLAAMMLIGGLT